MAMIRMTGESLARREQTETFLGWADEPHPDIDLIDLFSGGLLIVDQDLQVLRCNAAGRQYLGGGDEGLTRIPTRSLAGRGQDLRRLVRDAIVRGARNTLLLKPAGPDSLICRILPIDSGPGPAALIALTPLLGGPSDVIPHLRSLFKLSNAEAEVAAAAASGMDVVQMANARNVSIHTLRAQISAIKAKMGLSRMTEIAVTVSRIDAAVTWF
jgi:DNA-binding NarL/FixJ family response regulator